MVYFNEILFSINTSSSILYEYFFLINIRKRFPLSFRRKWNGWVSDHVVFIWTNRLYWGESTVLRLGEHLFALNCIHHSIVCCSQHFIICLYGIKHLRVIWIIFPGSQLRLRRWRFKLYSLFVRIFLYLPPQFLFLCFCDLNYFLHLFIIIFLFFDDPVDEACATKKNKCKATSCSH